MDRKPLTHKRSVDQTDAHAPLTQVEFQLSSPGPGCVAIEQVLVDERSAIQERRRVVGLPEDVHRNAVGMALSGGGLRSASFTLGFLQALARTRFLRQIDYLSTVSGGGYTGAFLSTLFHTADKPENPQKLAEYPLKKLDVVLGSGQGAQSEQILGVFVVLSFVNLNTTSLHGYYRDQLARVFLYRSYRKKHDQTLATLNCTSAGGPCPLLGGTLNRRPGDPNPSELGVTTLDTSLASGNRGSIMVDPMVKFGQTATEPFLLSPKYCGSERLNYRETQSYMMNRMRLDDAVAISGAAFSPLLTSNPLIGFLMTIFNIRLGQWLPNPNEDFHCLEQLPSWQRFLWGPTILRFTLERIWGDLIQRRPASAMRSFYFITDGGHHDNLGLDLLLQRRCRLIIVVDASQDGTYEFADLLRDLRRARIEQGVRVCPPGCDTNRDEVAIDDAGLLDLMNLLRPQGHAAPYRQADGDHLQDRIKAIADKSPRNRPTALRHYFLARIVYPRDDPLGPSTGWIIYVKSTRTGDEPVELQCYAANNLDFPHDPTSDQFYAEDRFESYRQLGEHIGTEVIAELTHSLGGGKGVLNVPCALGSDEAFAEMEKVQRSALETQKQACVQEPNRAP